MLLSIFMLGTGTEAIAYPDYPRGGLLDFFYDSLTSPKVLIEGPETYGSNKNQKIVKAVIAILRGLLAGNKQIALIAHSRGAISSLLVAHELKQVQEKLTRHNNLYDVLLATSCPEIRQAYAEAKSEILKLSEIKPKHLVDHEIAMLLLDPVRGGNYMGFRTGWTDTRMYQVPDNVKFVEIYIMTNERTCGFKASIPYALDRRETKVQVYPLYGNHGSAVGAAYDQKGNPPSTWTPSYKGELPPMVLSTNIAAIHLYNFLDRYSAQFDFSRISNRASFEQRQLMVSLMQTYTNVKTNQREFLLSQYAHMVKEKIHFDALNSVGYSILGIEGGENRIIHYHAADDNTNLDQIPGIQAPEGFVNLYHYELYERSFFAELEQLISHAASLKIGRENLETDIVQAAHRLEHVATTLLNQMLGKGASGDEACQVVISTPLYKSRSFQYVSLVIDNLIRQFITTDSATEIKARALAILQDMMSKLRAMLLPDSSIEAHHFVNDLSTKMRRGIEAHIDRLIFEISSLLDALPPVCTKESLDKVISSHTKARILKDSIQQLRDISTFDAGFQAYCRAMTLRLNGQLASIEVTIQAALTKQSLAQPYHRLNGLQKRHKVENIRTAVAEYTAWILENASGTRISNILQCKRLHLFHHQGGYNRANNLLEMIEEKQLTQADALEDDLDQFFQAVETAIDDSASNKHSLSRFIYKHTQVYQDSPEHIHEDNPFMFRVFKKPKMVI